MSQGYKAAHVSLPGCVQLTLLGIIPVSGLPGNWENRVSLATHSRVALYAATINCLSVWFTDNLDIPLSAMTHYALVIGIEFVESEGTARDPVMSHK